MTLASLEDSATSGDSSAITTSAPMPFSPKSGPKAIVCHTVLDAVKNKQCRPDILCKMLQTGFDVNYKDGSGNTALHHACWEGYNSKVAVLLEYGAEMVCNGYQETPVHWAMKSNNMKAINLMLDKHGIGILTQKDISGFGCFLLSAQEDKPNIMEWLYLKGVSLEEQDYVGRTALHWSAYKGNARVVQWLLSRSANIAHRDNEGMTPMHWAATRNQQDVVDMLLDVGGVLLLDIPDAEDDTPIDLARRKNNRQLLFNLLKSRLCHRWLGRPYIFKNSLAYLFWILIAWNVFMSCWTLRSITSAKDVFFFFVALSICSAFWCVSSFSDPGWVTANTILPQTLAILATKFDVEQPVETEYAVHYESGGYMRAPTEENVNTNTPRTPSKQQSKLQQQILLAATEELSNADVSTSAEDLQNSELQADESLLNERMERALEKVGDARRETLTHQGLSEYLDLSDKGEWKKICIVCRRVKEMRQHHCRECGRCMHRLDHHCPWIDNCVAKGNQRSFYCFIWSLFLTILYFYYISARGLYNEYQHFSFKDLQQHGLRVQLSTMHVFLLFTFALNFVWLGFVGLLILRHTVYMLVNLTTCEAMLRPAHVQRRFRRSASDFDRSQFWYLEGFGPIRALRNVVMYWMASDLYDAEDFRVAGNDAEEGLMLEMASYEI